MLKADRPTVKRGRDWSLAWMAGVLLLVNVPFLSGAVQPLHDTNYAYNAFYFFYNDFFFHNGLPLWEPFGRYGVQAYYPMITALSPAGIFTGLVGWCLRVRDTLFLFNLSLYFEQLVFLYGTYLLCKSLFRHRATVLFVCLSAALSSMLVLQIWWNFRVYSMLPLVLYFGFRFFSGLRLRDLGLAMAMFCISLIGVMPYVVSLLTLEVSVIAVFMVAANLGKLKGVLSQPRADWAQGIALIAFSALALAAFYYIWNASVDMVEGLGAARDPLSYVVDLKTFFTYGYLEYTEFTGLVVPFGKFIGGSITIYAGLIPLLFIVYLFARPRFLLASGIATLLVVGTAVLWWAMSARVTGPPPESAIATVIDWLLPLLALSFIVFVFIRTRDARVTAFVSVIAVLTLLSLGERTFFAKAVYEYFPLMKFFRHIGYVVAGFKLFIPILAGFGLDAFLNRARPEGESTENDTFNYTNASVAVAVFVILGSAVCVLAASFIMPGRLSSVAAGYAALTVLFLAAMLLLRRYMPRGRFFAALVVAGICFQMLGFQGLVDYELYAMERAQGLRYARESVMVHEYGFQPERTMAPPTQRAALARVPLQYPYTKMTEDPRGWIINYAFSYNFIQWDPCVPHMKLDYVSARVAELVRLEGGTTGKGKLTIPDNFALTGALGCTEPKLRLASDVVFSPSDAESKRYLTEPGKGERIVLNDVPDSLRQTWSEVKKSQPDAGVVNVRRFSANELEAEVTLPEGEGAWLYYADAWYPGWKAFVNGRPVPVARANYAFKAVMLEGGRNIVRFCFDGGLARYCVYFFSLLGLVFMAVVFVSMSRTFLSKKEYRQ